MIYRNINTNEDLSCQDIQEMESFICKMYGCKYVTSVCELRVEMILRKHKSESKDCIRKVDGNTLKGCSNVRKQKWKRTKLVAAMWLTDWKSLSRY